GPVPEIEVHRLLRSGVLSQDTLVWRDGMASWSAIATVATYQNSPLNNTTPPTQPMPSVAKLDEQKLLDRSESTAFALVCAAAGIALLFALIYVLVTLGILLIFAGFFMLALFIRHAMAFAHYRVNAVQVSPAQFPEIHRLASDFAGRLGRPLPEIYVLQDSLWNAFAMRLLGTPVVVLYSGVIDSILLKGDHRQLAFVIGHELGHHYAGHLGWKHFFASWGSWCIWPRLWYSRRCEFTCDRYGLACSGSLDAAQRAICNMAVGAQLADRVDVREAARQWSARRGEFFVRYRALYSTHPHTLDRLATLPAAAAELGVPA
ncbi:MAG: M48 family metalloprotease, partial [Limnohabitans sp.]|nr:M48 family metalloprotease [Limnohabitans sp.]